MNENIKRKWVKALRSEKYKQWQGQLRDVKGYCCLGVLCDIAPKKVGRWCADDDKIFMSSDKDSSIEFPTKAVKKWAGLTMRQCKQLSHLNDNNRWSFEQIADHIERKY
jgi:hypothetical protein